MDKRIINAYLNARKHLGLTQRDAANASGISNGAIGKLEKGLIETPNWFYTKFLVNQGINYFYLIGESDQLEGQIADTVSKSEHELLFSQFNKLKERSSGLEIKLNNSIPKSEYETLLSKYQGLQETIKDTLGSKPQESFEKETFSSDSVKMNQSTAFLYKTARKYLRLGQQDLASAIGVSHVSISNVETGKTQIPNHEHTKFLVERGINYYYLIGQSDKIEADSNDNSDPPESFEKETSSSDSNETNKLIPELYKLAREHLNLSQRSIARELGVSGVLISQVETGKTQSPNYEYTKFLIEQGINPFYLIGASDQIEGQLVDCVSRERFEQLKTEKEDLKNELEQLKNQVDEMVSRSDFEQLLSKYEALESLLQKSLTGQINKEDVRKKGKCAKKQPSRLSLKTGVLHAESPLFAERAVY